MTTDLNEKTYDETVANTEGVSIVQFTAPWCGPCRMLTPRLQELSEDRSVNYFKVNVDENGGLASRFRVMSIPTLQVYKNGVLVNTTVGVKSYNELIDLVESA